MKISTSLYQLAAALSFFGGFTGAVNTPGACAGEPRISITITNTQSNQSSQSFNAQITAPPTVFFTGAVGTVIYTPAPGDPSQIQITSGTVSVTSQVNSVLVNSGADNLPDPSALIESFQGGGTAALD